MRRAPNWADTELATLARLAIEGWPPEQIAERLSRPLVDVRARARILGLSLKPPPHSPFSQGSPSAAIKDLKRWFALTTARDKH